MIVALWGDSATGKTTIAKRIAERLGIPVRNCGEEIRAAASDAQVTLDTAPEALHRCVDEATRTWARGHTLTDGVLEGRFLDQVLAKETSVVFARVTCGTTVRTERWVERAGAAFSDANLLELDMADDLFRVRLYGSADKGAAHVTLDTSSGGVDQWTDELLRLVEEKRSTRHA